MTKKIVTATFVVLSSISLAACTTTNPYTGEKQISSTTTGVGVGALGGAAIGALVGGEKGAYIGAGVGGLAGGLAGGYMDKQDAELRQRLVNTGVQVQKEGSTVRLVMASDVTFKTDSADVNSSFYPTLDSVAIVLKKYKNTSVTVSGYTDNTGSAEHNQDLSERRAKSVADYLISQGASPNRFFTRGYGERNPVASNASSSGRAQNRRVEITLRPLK